jgi:EAL domain-containing protein (putative c-di-GMP-specific phosphodiesterase class I)
MLVELETEADGVAAAGAAAAIGRRIAELLEAPFRVADAEFRIGASVGAAVYPDDAHDAETLHRHADTAMYQAKESGGGFAGFRTGASDPLARLSMAAALRRGLESGAVYLNYQPIWSLPSRELVGLEALSRWRDPVRGQVGPDEFIPIAEKTGVINGLGDWALDQLCRDVVTWDALGMHPKFGFNVSPRQLQRPGFAADFAARVAAYGIDPGRVIIELTESGWTLEAARTMPILNELTSAGFVLALDDFGAGYSSLSRLRELPVKIIKIDRSFMTDLPDDPQAVAIIDAILALANACDCDVVTEGVETEAQIEFLCERDVRLVQGFALARPQSAETITGMLSEQLVASRRGR